MQAVILAGGLGTRLRPVTGQVPKVLVPVNGRPFLLELLEMLKGQGIVDVILCVGYRGEQVKELLRNGGSLGLRLSYSEEGERLLGTGGALRRAQPLLDEHFLVINGDTYLPLDYADLARAFLGRGKKSMMVAYDNREDTGVSNNITLDEEMMVVKHDKGAGDCDYVEAGVLALKREVLDCLEEGASSSLERGLYPRLIRQRELAAYITGQRFYDIGTPQQLGIFAEYLRRGRR